MLEENWETVPIGGAAVQIELPGAIPTPEMAFS